MKRKTAKRTASKKKSRKKAPARRRVTARASPKAVRRKPASTRRRKAKAAPPSRAAATRRKPHRAAKRAKPAARKRASATKPKRRPAVEKRPTQAAPVRAAEAAQAVLPFEPAGTTRALKLAPPPSGSVEALSPHVEDELRRRGGNAPDAAVVNALATAGAGYREGPAADPPFHIPVDLDARVAEGFVERYWVGEHSPGSERRDRKMNARAMIQSNFDQIGPPGVPRAAVDTLAAVALGAWRPGLEPLAQLHVYANLVAGWYRAGAT